MQSIMLKLRILVTHMFMLFVYNCGTNSNELTIRTLVGDIIGYEYDSELYPNKTAFQFLGIPYAEPPLGNLRFAKPVPKKPFSHIFNASEFGNSCMQDPYVFGGTRFAPFISPSEDCLTLNIFVPTDAFDGNRKSVMVFIYGGGFIVGATTISGGEHLAMFGDVIVVSMNYRVGPFGFLDMGVDEAPGNIGFWDQRLALKWVNENIESFGGLKNSVTIFGESAGAASVTYQMMYDGNKGLFQRAIAQSGSLATEWASTRQTDSRKLAQNLAKEVHCDSADTDATLTCMRDVNASLLTGAAMMLIVQDRSRKFAPIRDDDFVKFDPELCYDVTSECAKHMLEVEFMSGVNDFDGIVNIYDVYPVDQTWGTEGVTATMFQNDILPYVEKALGYGGDIGVLTELIHYVYTNHKNSSEIARLYEVSKLLTDVYFTIPAIVLNDISSAAGMTNFVYSFGHKSIMPLMPEVPLVYGANHADELTYVFGFLRDLLPVFNVSMSSISIEERNYANMIMTYWANFASSGCVY